MEPSVEVVAIQQCSRRIPLHKHLGVPRPSLHPDIVDLDWPENCNCAEDGREPTIEPNKQKAIGIAEFCGRFDTCRRSTLSCWRRTRISATSFVLGLKNEAMIWRISRRNSIIKWQGYRVSASRLAESNFRYTQDRLFLVQLYRWFPSVLKAITIIRPETVVRWHRAGFRQYWRSKSCSLGGRPKIDAELRALIPRMSAENPLWGAPTHAWRRG
jgi:hypothetical protein